MTYKKMSVQKEWTFINHGAFGAVLKEALQAETVLQLNFIISG